MSCRGGGPSGRYLVLMTRGLFPTACQDEYITITMVVAKRTWRDQPLFA